MKQLYKRRYLSDTVTHQCIFCLSEIKRRRKTTLCNCSCYSQEVTYTARGRTHFIPRQCDGDGYHEEHQGGWEEHDNPDHW